LKKKKEEQEKIDQGRSRGKKRHRAHEKIPDLQWKKRTTENRGECPKREKARAKIEGQQKGPKELWVRGRGHGQNQTQGMELKFGVWAKDGPAAARLEKGIVSQHGRSSRLGFEGPQPCGATKKNRKKGVKEQEGTPNGTHRWAERVTPAQTKRVVNTKWGEKKRVNKQQRRAGECSGHPSLGK